MYRFLISPSLNGMPDSWLKPMAAGAFGVAAWRRSEEVAAQRTSSKEKAAAVRGNATLSLDDACWIARDWYHHGDGHAGFHPLVDCDGALEPVSGGFDAVYGVATMATNWLRGTSHAIPHAEWWPTAVGFELQHSNIVTLALWVPHHLAAAVAVGFVLMLLSRPLTPMRGAVAGVAFTYAAFASAFVWLGALPFVAWVVLRHRPALTGLGVCAVVSAALALPNAWMYLRSDAPGIEWFGVVQDYWYERGFWWSLPAFVGVLAVEFLPLLVALRIGRRAHAEHRVPLLLANRHGLITGATGTGKTITLQTMAESFSIRKVTF